jgi:hypothetical protein
MKLRVVGRRDIPFTIIVRGKIQQNVPNDVLYVPGLKTNIFSIKCAVTQRGYSVFF